MRRGEDVPPEQRESEIWDARNVSARIKKIYCIFWKTMRGIGWLGASVIKCSFMIAVTETEILKFYICYVFS